MPNYEINVFGEKVTEFETDERLGQSLARRLQTSNPDTRVDSAGGNGRYSFEGQSTSRADLRDVKEMRESGGVIAQLVRAKALMLFGTGTEWEADDDEIAEWLRDNLTGLDNLLIDLGEDAIWFPRSFVEITETRGGDFAGVVPVEPWTMQPITDDVGEIQAWEQETRTGPNRHTETFDADEIASFVLNKASARDGEGISEALRAEEEITQFRENRGAVNKAIEVAGYPHHWWQVGREGASAIDDNELRRIRNMVDDMEGDTQFVTGRDVDHEMIKPGGFPFEQIQEHDLRELALSLGLPVELANVGSDGLGSGMPADLRLTLFERQARASQRALAQQFVDQIARPVLEQYSPFDADANLSLRFGDPIDTEEMSLADKAPWLTTNEMRESMGKAPADDPEIGDSYRKPANIEAPEQEEPEDGGGFGGLFGSDVVKLADGSVLQNLETNTLPDWDRQLLTMHRAAFETDGNTRVLSFTESELPNFVKRRLKDAIRGGAVFSQFDTVPSDELMQMRLFLEEELTESGGWTMDGLANRLQDLEADLSFDEAQTIARTETASIVNTAREMGYEEKGQSDSLFYWTGATKAEDDRTTLACDWLIRKTNPHEGGNPVPMDRLKELIAEAPTHDPQMPDDIARPENFVVHPQERKTFVRHVE